MQQGLSGARRSDLELIADFMMKKCYLCSFNNGGHLFAAAGGGNVITVYNVTTHQVMATFKVCFCILQDVCMKGNGIASNDAVFVLSVIILEHAAI